MRRASPEAIADHNRDLAKHEPRPTDPIDAIQVALIVKGLRSVADAAGLIEQYARTVAEGARLEGIQSAYDRMNAAFDVYDAKLRAEADRA